MAKKSEVREAAELALEMVGIKHKGAIYIDKSNSGHRVKFAHLRLSGPVMEQVRKNFAAQIIGRDTRTWTVVPAHGAAFGGTAFKIFN